MSLPTFTTLTPNRRLLVGSLLLLPLLLIVFFLYWQSARTSNNNQNPSTNADNDLTKKTSSDSSFNFSYQPFWKVTEKEATSFKSSQKATTYEFKYSIPDLSDWFYEMTVYTYGSSNLTSLTQTLVGTDVKTSPCENRTDCLVIEDAKAPVQAVFSGSQYSYAVKLFDQKKDEIVPASKPVGPLLEVLETFKAN